jgi:hypothetical protein
MIVQLVYHTDSSITRSATSLWLVITESRYFLSRIAITTSRTIIQLTYHTKSFTTLSATSNIFSSCSLRPAN